MSTPQPNVGNIMSGATQQIQQRVTDGVTNSITQMAMGFFTTLLATATDIAFWVALIAIPLLFTETGQGILRSIIGDNMFNNVMDYRNSTMAWLGSSSIGRGLDSLLNAIGMGTPFQGAASTYVRSMSAEQFQQQSGLPRNASDILYPLREELVRRGINTQNALQTGQRNADGTYQDGNIEFLLKNLSTEKLGTLFDALRNSGTPEQRNANKAAIQNLLQNEEVLRILNEKHRPLISRMAAVMLQGEGGTMDVAAIKQLVTTPQGLATLAAAVPAIPAATLTSLGVTQAQLQSAISDMQANNPKGQAYRTLIANDMLPVLGSIGQRLQGNATLTASLEVLRSPQLRERLSNPEIVGALARVAPDNAASRTLFTAVRGTDGAVSYPNITAGLQLAAHLDSGTEQQRTQRAAAVASIDTLLTSGRLPTDTAALQRFFADDENRAALKAFVQNSNVADLPEHSRERRIITALRTHGDNIMTVLATPEGMRYVATPEADRPYVPPMVVLSNRGALKALEEAAQNTPATAAAPQRTSSLAEPSIAEQIQQAAGAARIAGVANATVAVGAPNVADLTRLPVREPSASTVIG